MSDIYEDKKRNNEGEEDQKNQENFDETTKNVNAYDRKNSKHNSGYSRTEP